MATYLFQKMIRMAALLTIALVLVAAALSAAYVGHRALADGDDGPHSSRMVLPCA